jgi:hypothetical protein
MKNGYIISLELIKIKLLYYTEIKDVIYRNNLIRQSELAIKEYPANSVPLLSFIFTVTTACFWM